MKLTKIELRQFLLEKRKQFFIDRKNDYQNLNEALLKNIKKFLDQHTFKYCVSFKSIHGEPDLTSLSDLNKNLKIAYPLIENNQLTFIFNGMFNVNSFGLIQPVKGTGEEISLDQVNVILVPGIGFDLSGNRIGYGKGFYDRALSSSHKKLIKVGICFEFQISDCLDVDSFDVEMDYLITDQQIVECKK